MSAETNKQIVRDYFQAIGGGDLEKALGLTSEGFVFTLEGTTTYSGTYTGHAEVQGFFANIAGAIDFEKDLEIEIQDMIAEGDKVVVRSAGKMTSTSGKPYNNRYCHVFTVRDGKIQSDIEYLDTALVTEALG